MRYLPDDVGDFHAQVEELDLVNYDAVELEHKVFSTHKAASDFLADYVKPKASPDCKIVTWLWYEQPEGV